MVRVDLTYDRYDGTTSEEQEGTTFPTVHFYHLYQPYVQTVTLIASQIIGVDVVLVYIGKSLIPYRRLFEIVIAFLSFRVSRFMELEN